jgi:hypothetical protein
MLEEAERRARLLEINLRAYRVALDMPTEPDSAIELSVPHVKHCKCESGVSYVHHYPRHAITVRGTTYLVDVPACHENYHHHESLICAMEFIRKTKRVTFTCINPGEDYGNPGFMWPSYSSFIALCDGKDRLRCACRRLTPPWYGYYCVEDVRSHYGKIRLSCFGCGKIASLKNHEGFYRVAKSYVDVDGRRPHEGRLFCGTECQYETKDVEFIKWQRARQRAQMDERELALDDVRTGKACISAIQKFTKTRDREALQSLLEELQPPATSQTSAAR